MSEMTFNAEEFADYWESFQNDEKLGIDFMAKQVSTGDGRDLLAATVTTLAGRHGVSSDKVKTFRTALRKACKQAGLEDIWTPKKVAGTGTKSYPDPVMVLEPSKPHTKPKMANRSKTAYDRMRKWVKNEGFIFNDIDEAFTILRNDFIDGNL